jgi:hypothetical protein
MVSATAPMLDKELQWLLLHSRPQCKVVLTGKLSRSAFHLFLTCC